MKKTITTTQAATALRGGPRLVLQMAVWREHAQRLAQSALRHVSATAVLLVLALSVAIPSAEALEILLASGDITISVKPRLEGLGHTVTESNAATWDSSFDYSSFDVVAFPYGCSNPADLAHLVAAVQAGAVGVVFFRGYGAEQTAEAFGMAPASLLWYQTPTNLNIVNNSHFITQTQPLGPQNLGYGYMASYVPDGAVVTTLATGPSTAALVVHQTLRVVFVPYYAHPASHNSETAAGIEITQRSLLWAAEPPCGNGVLDAGEQCDDENAVDGDCCSSTCQAEAPNSPCDDGQFCTVNDQCDGMGTCSGSANACSDSNTCTADSCDEDMDVCAHAEAPRNPATCLVAPSTKLQIKNSDTVGKDKLSWSWGKGDAFAQTDLGTPNVAMSTSYTLCVYDTTAMVPSLKASIDIAPSATLWATKDPKGLQYKDKSGTSEGVTKAQMKTGDATKTMVKVSAGGTNLVLPAPAGATFFNQTPTVTVQLVNSAGKCWTSAFVAADTKTNEADSFKAQTK